MALFRFLRRSQDPFAVPSSMVGVKMGDRFLQLGCTDVHLFAALAGKVGLTGQATAVDGDETRVRAAKRTAEQEGVLASTYHGPVQALPFDPGSFDIVAVDDILAGMRPEERVRCLQEALRVLRPGGRCIIIERAGRGGLGALLSQRAVNPAYARSGGALRALQEEGFKAARLLGEAEGRRYFEAVKAGGL